MSFSRADAYERFMGRWSRLLAPALVDFAGVGDGDATLDVGAGTGALSRALGDATGDAPVAGVDASHEYVAEAVAGSRDPRLGFLVADARRLPFGDAGFDGALSLLAINFVPEPARAVAEMARVTRPGGVVAAAVWDYPDGMAMLRRFWDEATALDASVDPRDERHMPLCRPGELAALWREQGLGDVEETALVQELHFASFADYWEPFLLGQGPAGAHASGLAPAARDELAERLRRRLLGGGPDRGFELPARAWAVKGRVVGR